MYTHLPVTLTRASSRRHPNGPVPEQLATQLVDVPPTARAEGRVVTVGAKHVRSGGAGLALLHLGPKPAAGAGHYPRRRRCHCSIRRRRRQGGFDAIGCARHCAVPPECGVRPSGRVRLAPALCAKRRVAAVSAPDVCVEPANVAPERLRVSSQRDRRWPSRLLLRHGCRWRRRKRAGRSVVGSDRLLSFFEHLLQQTFSLFPVSSRCSHGLVAASSRQSHGVVAASSWSSRSHRRPAESRRAHFR